MPSGSLKAFLCVSLSLMILVYAGCSQSESPKSRRAFPTTSKAKQSQSQKTAAEPKSKSEPALAAWKNPRAVLLVSGQMEGYLEPCGCTGGQLGGLIRRFDFVEQMRAKGWPVALIDLGSMIKDPNIARGGGVQAKIKFGIALKAMSLLKYDAIGLSAEDLKVGINEAFAGILNDLAESTRIVTTNVTPSAGFESRIMPSHVIDAGPLKIGVTSVIDPQAIAQLSDPDKDDWLTSVTPPEEALEKVLVDLTARSEIQVLMVQGSAEMAKQLAGKFPGFDIVVSTTPGADPLESEPALLNDGKTMLVQVGRRGKYLGALGFFEDSDPRTRFQLVSLDDSKVINDSPMKRLVEGEFRNLLKSNHVVETFPKHDHTGGAPGATFVGAETCRECHPNTYKRWAATKHARAFDSLEHDPRPNTIYDAECITCHTTGFEYTSGYASELAAVNLRGNQCENCHGPASKHLSEPENLEFRRPMKLTADLADKERLCIRCHDEDNSPKFTFPVYWGQITHKGLDDYKDPKVRQGIKPSAAAEPKSPN